MVLTEQVAMCSETLYLIDSLMNINKLCLFLKCNALIIHKGIDRLTKTCARLALKRLKTINCKTYREPQQEYRIRSPRAWY